jgi:hypothetical protein
MRHHSNSHIQAIMDLFPEVTFDPTRFKGKKGISLFIFSAFSFCISFMLFSFCFFLTYNAITENDWHSSQTRREFLDNFAKQRGLDPLERSTWSNLKRRHIVQAKVCFISFFCIYSIFYFFFLFYVLSIFMQGGGLLRYHQNSHTRAVIDLYPELNLSVEDFTYELLSSLIIFIYYYFIIYFC